MDIPKFPQPYPLVATTENGREWLVIGWTKDPHALPSAELLAVAVPWESGLTVSGTGRGGAAPVMLDATRIRSWALPS